MTLLSLLLVALGICHQVAAWGLLVPTHILGKTYLHWWGKSLIGPNEERQRVQVEITNKDGGGYNWPYQFEVWKNASGKADERIHLQDVRATPVFWDNNQPVGTFIRFRFKDVNRFVFGSEFIQVEPNPTVFVSSASTMSTATITSSNNTTVRASATEMASARQVVLFYNNYTPGVIAGGVVGGVLLLAAITTALVFFLRVSKHRKEKVDLLNQPTAATPFIYQHPYHSRTNQQFYDDLFQPYQGAGNALPIPPSPPILFNPSSPEAPPSYGAPSAAHEVSTRNGAYAALSTVPH
ncbi:unnamed protein product [Rhizoctonia solani]|uniref:Uncharacterized protein n=1 Tax=Rhizoctonia solani TaxID=456999 RepID=A0A8H3AVR8_9AGAM|nr:unnamed protein product [Rhizoctonia solani]